MSTKKRPRGRPPGRRYTEQFNMLFEPSELAALDEWCGDAMTRSEAIRLAIKRLLKTKRPAVRSGR